MFTRVPWEVTGGYLEGNYNMGGSGGEKTGQALDYLGRRIQGGDSTHYEDMGKKADKDASDSTNIDEQFEKGKQNFNTNLEAIPGILDHNFKQPGNYLYERFHGSMNKGGDDDDTSVTQRDTSAFAQSKKPRKKRKGLLALQTPSAKASRFRAGKRRFRVRPTGKTGVNTGARSSGVSVPKG